VVYENSLSLAFLALFVFSFVGHAALSGIQAGARLTFVDGCRLTRATTPAIMIGHDGDVRS